MVICLAQRVNVYMVQMMLLPPSHLLEVKTQIWFYFFVSNIAIFVLKRNVKLQQTNQSTWFYVSDNVLLR